jgi:hypothetical protein
LEILQNSKLQENIIGGTTARLLGFAIPLAWEWLVELHHHLHQALTALQDASHSQVDFSAHHPQQRVLALLVHAVTVSRTCFISAILEPLAHKY